MVVDLGYRADTVSDGHAGPPQWGVRHAPTPLQNADGLILMIESLECDETRIERISSFTDAIYCLHTSPLIGLYRDPVAQVRAFRHSSLKFISRLPVSETSSCRLVAEKTSTSSSQVRPSPRPNDIAMAYRACREGNEMIDNNRSRTDRREEIQGVIARMDNDLERAMVITKVHASMRQGRSGFRLRSFAMPHDAYRLYTSYMIGNHLRPVHA